MLGGVVLAAEALFFQLLHLVYDDVFATTVIGLAVLGLAAGGLLATRVPGVSDRLFARVALGTALALLVALGVLLFFPYPLAVSVALLPVVACPGVFIGAAFREHSSRHVYLCDMVGAGLGVAFVVGCLSFLRSEHAFGVLLALLGGLAAGFARRAAGRLDAVAWTGGAVALGGLMLFVAALTSDAATFSRALMWAEASRIVGVPQKAFDRATLANHVRSYESMVGRLDLAYVDETARALRVLYDGHPNDLLQLPDYRFAVYRPEALAGGWRILDPRVFVRRDEHPRFLVIGAAAAGILPAVRRLVPPENIVIVEINPAIRRVMLEDYAVRTGQLYGGLRLIPGNALVALRGSGERFDVITLINVHSTKSLVHPGPPDYVHTLEAYRLYLQHLGPRGYLLLEERPDLGRHGVLAFWRELHTLWRALAAEGATDPARHFFIWEWMNRPVTPRRGSPGYFVSLLVSRQPLAEADHAEMRAWIDAVAREHFQADMPGDGAPSRRALWLPGEAADRDLARLFALLGKQDTVELARLGLDPTPATDDRPYLAWATLGTPQVDRQLARLGAAALVVLAGVLVVLQRRGGAPALALGGYNVLLAIGYFFVEVLLLHVGQRVFLAPASAFLVVLGGLLASSGAGGVLGARLGVAWATALLAGAGAAAVLAPPALHGAGVPLVAAQALFAGLVVLVGGLMGSYFPAGLEDAKARGLVALTPYLFAANGAAGAVAALLALKLGIVAGHRVVLTCALAAYVAAAGLRAFARRA